MIKKYTLTPLTLLVCILLAFALPSLVGQAQAGAQITAFAVALEGEFLYVAGEATNLAGAMPAGALDLGGGMKDIYLAKLRLDGSLVYSALIGGSDDDSPYGLLVRQGVVYLLGETWSYDFPNAPGNAGESDALLLALAADGSQVLWARRFGGSDQDEGRALALYNDALYLTGITWSGDLLPGAALGDADGFLARVGLDGRLDWLTLFGGSALDAPFDLTVSGEGVWVAGQSLSRNFGGTHHGAGDAFAARFSLAGEQQFARLYGGREEDMAYAITRAGDGVVFLAGGTRSAGLTPAVGTHAGGFDGFLMRIAPDGSLLSTTYLGGTGADYAQQVLPLAGGGALVTGVTFSPRFPLGYDRQETGAGQSNAFIAHLDGEGGLVDAWLAGGTGNDLAYRSALTAGGLWLAGRFSTGPLGYALQVPPEDIPGVPLPEVVQPQPTATLALTATPQPTETPAPSATPTPTFTATATFTATPMTTRAEDIPFETEVATVTATRADDVGEVEPGRPTQDARLTQTVAVALTQGTPVEGLEFHTETPDVSSEEDGGQGSFPTGLVVGGALLLAAGVGGALYANRRSHVPADRE